MVIPYPAGVQKVFELLLVNRFQGGDAQQLVDIVGLTAKRVEYFNVKPRIAMLSYSNFGSSNGDTPNKMKEATALSKELIFLNLLAKLVTQVRIYPILSFTQ